MIWIDYNVDKGENLKYQKRFEKIISPIKLSKTIDDGLKEIKKLKFKKVTLILTKSIFNDFIKKFEEEKKEYMLLLKYYCFY